jgi:membrane protein required for colicin V production
MNWPDYAILAVIVISIGVGALRGFIMEVFSLLVWVAAFGVAYHFAGDVAVLMEGSVTLPSARIAMGFAGLFIAVLLVGGLINYLLGRLVESTGLSGTDRLLGGAFGAARGLALVLVLLLVAGLTPLPQDPWWQESRVIARLMPMVDWAATYLPESIAGHLDFDPAASADKDPSGNEGSSKDQGPSKDQGLSKDQEATGPAAGEPTDRA